MKFITIVLSILMGIMTDSPSEKNYDYAKAWQEVEKFINEGLPKSALEKVEEIHQMAVAEKNDRQMVKSIIYIARLSIQTDEKGIEQAIQKLEDYSRKAEGPVSQITASYLAELYQRYFDNNRWEISQRAEISGEKGPDFRTWTTQQFLSTIEKWYLYSITSRSLQDTPVETFPEIMNEYDKAATHFRPTLYEVLADRCFDFFNNYDNYSNENTESFTVSESWYSAPASEFVQKLIVSADSLSTAYKLLQLYQAILRTQIQSGNTYALADYDLKRLEYVYRKSTREDKNELYRKGLEDRLNTSSDIDFYTEIAAVLAANIRAETADSMANIKAMEVCNNAINKYPNSPGASKCRQIIIDIKRPFVQLYAEQVYVSKNQLLVALDYNNISKVVIETVKLDPHFYELVQKSQQEEIMAYLRDKKKVNSTVSGLKVSATLRQQRTEINLPSLPYGEYAILVRSDEKGQDLFQYVIIHVSDLAYSTYIADGKRVFLVTDRKKGQFLPNVKLTLYQQNYNSSNRRYDFIKTGSYTTDDQGKVTIGSIQERNFKAVLEKGKDKLDLQQYHYNYSRSENQEYRFAEIFTDRSIYRPGQTVYFKSILLKNDKNNIPTLLTGQRVKIVFRDANYQEVSQLNLVSSEFGSLNGSFTIPTNKLNGAFTISIESDSGISGQKNIQVEEYKRPTFEVTLDEVKGEIKLNDAVVVTGSAVMLAGSPADGAEVSYKVKRNARFPGWPWWWRMPVESGEFLVAQGRSTTDAEGRFQVSFTAVPDLKVSKKDQPVFTFTVEVEVTDQRGETRVNQSDISVGYTAFTLSVNLDKEVDLEALKPVKVIATGTSGQNPEVSGVIKISALKEPKAVQISKYWEGKIDFPLHRGVAEKYFPQYPANDRPDFSLWPVQKVIFDSSFSTKDSLDLASKMEAGVYKIELEAKDKNNQSVSSFHYVVVTDFKKSIFPKSDFLFTKVNKNVLEAGEQLDITLGSAEKAVFTQTIIEKDGHILYEKTIKTTKMSRFSMPILEAYRGGFNVKVSWIIQNRRFEKSFFIQVPWRNKELKINFETFRDKTLPGSKEEYRIAIQGQKQDKIAAELLVSMYDASLDQFMGHAWRNSYYPTSYASINLEVPGFNLTTGQYYHYGNEGVEAYPDLTYPALIPLITYYGGYGNVMMKNSRNRAGVPTEDMVMSDAVQATIPVAEKSSGVASPPPAPPQATDGAKPENPEQPLRKNLKETVFFFPEMKTDQDGRVILSFTMNEALTKWRMMTFAHTRDLMTGYDERFVRTQKDLMIFPNPPRFLRDGDQISFSAKVTNLTSNMIEGKATLLLFDALTQKDITSEILTVPASSAFKAEQGRSSGLVWDLKIPEGKYAAITYRIQATSGAHTDGEENTIPVLTNLMLVTESMPMWLKAKETKTFTFQALKNNLSPTKKDFKYTLEYTSNPVWYAIQALPYIQVSANASTQSFVDRLYANALASMIATAHPKIKAVFDQWLIKDKDALLSNLSKNQELKSAILEESPWVLQSLSEAEQKRNIALLFDLNKLADEKAVSVKKLAERQLPNGGFSWLPGGRDDCYTTQNVLENIGHLYHIGALEINDPALAGIVGSGLKYMDEELTLRYQRLVEQIKKYGGNIHDDHLDDLSIHYLYIKTFFKHVKPMSASSEAREYYAGQAKKYWLKRGLYSQAMIGLILSRNNDPTVKNVVRSLREKSFSNDEMGMYWNEGNGFYWYQLPIERHALMIELFVEEAAPKDELDRMKIWLLKNKQTNHWKTSKSTAAAIYALLLKGEDGTISSLVTESGNPFVTIGQEKVNLSDTQIEAGTGYFKKVYASESISKDMAVIKIANPNNTVTWGAAYYQYFERLDKIKSFADTPLKLSKKLYKVVRTAKGDLIEEITPTSKLKPGDKVKVRIELRSDREMEYVHMKDMRASGFEPVNVISAYTYQGSLGYYETTKDMATHFYFSYLPKGTFVFEYDLRVVHRGDFSGGITLIECMYAPEFTSHSEGIRVTVQ